MVIANNSNANELTLDAVHEAKQSGVIDNILDDKQVKLKEVPL